MAGSISEVGPAARSSPARLFLSAKPCVLFYVVGAVAVVCLGAYAAVDLAGGAPVRPLDLTLATVMFAAAQLARIYHRVRGEAIMIAWGEVGVITALCLVPASWLPIVVAAGTVVGHGYRLIGADGITRARVLYTISVITVGGVTAATVVVIIADPTTALRANLDSPGPLVPLALAGAAYYLTTSLLSAAWAATTTGGTLAIMWLSVARTKRVMLALGVPIGIGVALAASAGSAFVAVLAPFLWLVHLIYSHYLTLSAERRIWTALAEATRSLHQLDERGVATAAVRGAMDIFSPVEVELSWHGPGGPTRRYTVRAGDPESGPDGAALGARRLGGPVGHETHRPLVVGRVRMGALRLRFRHPLPLTAADAMAFATFADAVASAMHDVGTHRHLQDLAARSAYDAIHDSLTGLSNRSMLLAQGNAQLRDGDPCRPVALVLLGLDGFRAVNETLNYEAGDDLLRILARRLATTKSRTELLGRIDGDVFALLLTDLGGSGDTAIVVDPMTRARELATTIAAPVRVSGVTLAAEASAGVVVAMREDVDMTELLRRADMALHKSKRTGNRITRYDSGTDSASADRLALLADLRDALATTDQLDLHIQPAVDMRTGVPVSAEVLARWRHPRRGLLMPEDFIPAMEHSELATGFTLHIVDQALRVAAGWATQGVHVPVSVNLCARCMINPDLAPLVASRLTKYGVAPQQLIVEMSESVMDSDEALVRRVITDLRGRGMQVSVDDFGTGPAPLSLLTRFAVDEVKIDRSFVAGMGGSAETAAIVRTTVDLAHALGLRIVAEGVERADQRSTLLRLGVTIAQGYLFHAPVSVTDATALVQGRLRAATDRTIPIVAAPSS